MEKMFETIGNVIRRMTADRRTPIGTSNDASIQIMRTHAAIR